MTAEEIIRSESLNVVFMKSLPEKNEKLLKTIVAFANSSGGKLIIGVEDDTGKIVGVDTAEVFSLMHRITSAVSDSIEPQITPHISFSTVEGKSIIIVEVYPGSSRPYYLKAPGKKYGTYIRVAGTTCPADPQMIHDLELQGANQSYDKTVIVGKELDMNAVMKLCTAITDCMKRSETSSVHKVTIQNLEKWGILKRVGGELKPTVAFDLLTTNTNRFAKVQCACFEGTTSEVLIDRHDFEGCIYSQIEEAYQFVLKHINLSAKINGQVREDVYELPVDAIREAIVNAVMHRNYMEKACVQVCIFDDRVEITSPGLLYNGLDLKMILEGKSRIRNAGIAEVFSRMHIVGAWGTGIQTMIESCRAHQIASPVFEESGSSFRVIFMRQLHDQIDDQINVQKDVRKDTPAQLERKAKIIAMLKQQPKLKTWQIADLLRCSYKTAYRCLQEMIAEGTIKRTGSRKVGRWEISSSLD